jgi:hypothetical protein
LSSFVPLCWWVVGNEDRINPRAARQRVTAITRAEIILCALTGGVFVEQRHRDEH